MAILMVASIAINNVDETSLRKPFPASADAGDIGKVSVFDSLKESTEQSNTTENGEENEELVFTPEEIAYFDDNFGELSELTKENAQTISENKIENSSENEAAGDKINAELLRKAGFSNFFLQKKPFEGKMFNQFDFSELVSVGVEFYEVVERIFGNEKEILEVFYFSAAESSLNNEIYNLLKEKFKAELGVKINETNSFGLASFYINLEAIDTEISNKVFLVVKMKEGVYALSYPRGSVNLPAKDNSNDKYFQSVKNLLNELLQQ